MSISTAFIIVLSAVFCYPVLADQAANKPESWFNYQWGSGLTIPAANLNIGGYFKGSYERPEFSLDTFSLNDLSLFITWTPHARLRFFAELEEHDWITAKDGMSSFSEQFNVERLFVDVLIDESTSLRFGKYLTPFGRWNVIHSAPLVWTTTRPIITDDTSFALRANGLMLNYTQIVNEHNLDVSVYLDNSTDLEPKSFNKVVFDQAAGLRINYEVTEELQIGASYLAYQNLSDFGLPVHHAAGVDFMWQHAGYELLMESLYHLRDDPEVSLEEKGVFLQGVAPLGFNVFAVARYEYLDNNAPKIFSNNDITHVGLAGIAWRPYLPIVFKSEYRFGDNNRHNAYSGLFVSVAMFF